MAIQYENAPIKEALIDIRVELPANVSIEILETIHGRVKDKYPTKNKSLQLNTRISAGDEVGASAHQTHLGFIFTSEDGKQIMQARRDGFTFGRMKPYGNWIELRDEAKRLWDIYCDVTSPIKIGRLAVRYINQIDIPFAVLDYKDYFYTTPEVSPKLSQTISAFFMQIHFPQPSIDGMLILTQAVVPPPGPNMNSVILDLDVFKVGDFTAIDEIWVTLNKLRGIKNEFFEGSITDKTRELFGTRSEY